MSLEEKIAARSGRLQLIVAKVSEMARANSDPNESGEGLETVIDELCGLAGDFGPKWLDETSMLLKEMYNRREGP
jgi:hypothetical protein